MSFLPHKKFTWADFGGIYPDIPRRYAPANHYTSRANKKYETKNSFRRQATEHVFYTQMLHIQPGPALSEI